MRSEEKELRQSFNKWNEIRHQKQKMVKRRRWSSKEMKKKYKIKHNIKNKKESEEHTIFIVTNCYWI